MIYVYSFILFLLVVANVYFSHVLFQKIEQQQENILRKISQLRNQLETKKAQSKKDNKK